ncbi:hypothetical protein MUP32_06275 [Candidatus Microgenomates bacterium]|nr:hypothetical protein [Candidatus Microgenomates bacterium]
MKKILMAVVAIVFLTILAWRLDRAFFHPYIPDYQEQIRSDVTTLKFTVPKDKEGCEKIGGVWKKMGPRPVEECNLPTKDSGKSCESSNVCEGVCLAQLSRDDLQKGMRGQKFKTQGKCSSFIKIMGCQAYVYQGWASVVCAD